MKDLERDAQRYRWLRDNAQGELGTGGKFDLKKHGTLHFSWIKYEWRNGVPAEVLPLGDAIDAAIAKALGANPISEGT
jgi:hypothetical protein